MLSTAKSQAVSRDLKELLEKRGFAVVESMISKGMKLAIDSDAMSIRIQAQDAVSKDIFGNALDAFTPHDVKLAIKDNTDQVKVAVLMMELSKIGFDLKIAAGADIAAAEAAADAAEAQRNNIHWPKKGA
jgi:hypothetical protein